MKASHWFVAMAAVGASGCGLAPAGGVPGGFAGPREEVVLVGSYGEVLAMSGGRRILFAASSDGLAMFDRLSNRWLPPLTPFTGYPAATLTTVSADPELDAVWLGGLGEVLYFDPALDQLSRTIVPGRVDRIVFDRDAPAAGAFVASGGVWTRITPSGIALPVRFDEVPPSNRQWRSPDLDELTRRHLSLPSFSGLLTRDGSLRSWQLTAGTTLGERGDVWIGTLGGGVYRVDLLFNRGEHVPYGLFERGASALARAADGVWIGSEGRHVGGTGGAAATDGTLQEWAWLRGPSDGSMAGVRVNDLVVRDGVLWIATSLGVAQRSVVGDGTGSAAADRTDRAGGWRWIRRGNEHRASSLAPSRDGMWVGTDRGLVELVVDASAAPPVARGPAVGALLRLGDSLWVGTSTGLALADQGGRGDLRRPALSPSSSVVDRRIRALAASDSVLVVATDDAVALVDVHTRAARSLPAGADPREVAPITAVAVDGSAIWIGGERGLMVIDRSGSGRVVPGPPPGVPINDLVVDRGLIWLATPEGIIRMRTDLWALPNRR